MPEDDGLAVQLARACPADEGGQRLGRVDRVDQDPLGPRRAVAWPPRPPRSGGRSRRRAGTRRGRSRPGDTGGAPTNAARSASCDSIDGRSSASGRATRTPTIGPSMRPDDAVRDDQARLGPARRRGQEQRVRSDVGRGELVERLGGGLELAVDTGQPGPADPDHVRPATGRPSAPRRRASTIASAFRPLRGRRAGGRSPRTPPRGVRPDRAGRRAGRTGRGGPRVRPSPRPAAVNRQWFDQRRPLVTSVSAPSASAAPTRNSRFRSLFPPNASGSRSSRLIQISTPSAEGRRERGQAVKRRRPRRTARSEAARPRAWPRW